ncbi:uncharacterized protein BX663DRAFT_510260 [Cokeromyces recurvatus]|uniref:uncharacterized protein n=1 Tax=Cokeromyces recurvatus TaxID=90255 RepID=UPI00221F2BD2|nr:uncharacterized protein BX663DRAFT_510260 [Cokeromyces recurvatus]KAI7902724.1 hypothetical protein BX663DRAFT_510260 [Cokeromyces recurvatus]
MKKISLIMLKKLSIYLIIVMVVIITWTQFDLIINLKKDNSSNNTLFAETSFVKFSQQSSEVDPATWLIQTIENESVLKQPSIFPPYMVFSADSYPPVTAIVNRIDDSDEGIIQSIQHLLKYPFFKEIFIYNQVKTRRLSLKLLYSNITKSSHSDYKDIPIHIIEDTNTKVSNSSMMGKFRACEIGSYDKCYFQDDLWLNPYLDSLYTHSYRYPEHLIVNTRPVNYIDYIKWRFENKNISLHTGYTNLRYGGFIPRHKVQRFSSHLLRNQKRFESLNADFVEIYFSIWLNQHPYLIFNPLLSSGRDSFKDIDTINNRASIEYFMYDALSMLETFLKNDSLLFEKKELLPSVEERDVRSSCANDKCLFITNIDPMPPNRMNENYLQFNSEFIKNLSQYETLYQDQFNRSIPSKSSYLHSSYHKAVDQDTETCWSSVHYPKKGDYFGLYMTGNIIAKRVMLYTNTFEEDERLDELFKISVQFVPFGPWIDCDIKLTPLTQLSYRIGFDFDCLSFQEPFKSIRIYFKKDLNKAIDLCGIGLDNFVV